jgi:hypothetical protein
VVESKRFGRFARVRVLGVSSVLAVGAVMGFVLAIGFIERHRNDCNGIPP